MPTAAGIWKKAVHQGTIIHQLGLRSWSQLKLRPALAGMMGRKGLGRVTLPGMAHPLEFRLGTSDAWVMYQIYVEREYDCFDDGAGFDLVLDCGANAGYSSAYFLSRYPGCRVVAVEPDPGNFAMLGRNTAPYGGRATLHRAAIWPRRTSLKFSEEPYRGGMDWSHQVVECGPGEESSVPGIDVGSLIEASGGGRVSLLKMDIEGAEALVFGDGGYESWIDRVDNIAIEIHDDTMFGPASAIFARAIEGRGFAVSHSGELTICKRIRA